MNLSRNDVIAGYPAKKIRDLLRHSFSGVGAKLVAHQLKIEGKDATALLNQLTDDGYLEICHFGDKKLWRNTIKGNALRQGKFMKPISRDRAEEVLNNFRERVATVNSDPYYFIGIVSRMRSAWCPFKTLIVSPSRTPVTFPVTMPAR